MKSKIFILFIIKCLYLSTASEVDSENSLKNVIPYSLPANIRNPRIFGLLKIFKRSDGPRVRLNLNSNFNLFPGTVFFYPIFHGFLPMYDYPMKNMIELTSHNQLNAPIQYEEQNITEKTTLKNESGSNFEGDRIRSYRDAIQLRTDSTINEFNSSEIQNTTVNSDISSTISTFLLSKQTTTPKYSIGILPTSIPSNQTTTSISLDDAITESQPSTVIPSIDHSQHFGLVNSIYDTPLPPINQLPLQDNYFLPTTPQTHNILNSNYGYSHNNVNVNDISITTNNPLSDSHDQYPFKPSPIEHSNFRPLYYKDYYGRFSKVK